MKRRRTYNLIDKTVLLLHFEYNATDSSSLKNPAINTPSFTSGKFSRGAVLSASSYFTINISEIKNLADWTIEFFYKDDGTKGSDFTGIFTTGQEGQKMPWIGMRYMASYGRGLFVYISDGVTTNHTNFSEINTALDLLWHHYAIVYKNGVLRVYVDGVLKTTLICNLKMPTLGNELTSGVFSNIHTRTTVGVMDELRISNTARYTSNFTPPNKPFK